MAIYFYSDDPQALLDAFDEAIEDGTIVNWEIDEDGDYTHVADPWSKRAWFASSIGDNCLAFSIVPDLSEVVPRSIFAFYQADLIETFVNHLHEQFTNVMATPDPDGDDQGDIVD
jgi:hypothetical protein